MTKLFSERLRYYVLKRTAERPPSFGRIRRLAQYREGLRRRYGL